jgi:hypothetical protein
MEKEKQIVRVVLQLVPDSCESALNMLNCAVAYIEYDNGDEEPLPGSNYPSDAPSVHEDDIGALIEYFSKKHGIDKSLFEVEYENG